MYVAGNNKTHLDVYVKFPMFSSGLNQAWIILTDFY